MYLKNKYYYFKKVIPERICNDILSYASSQKKEIGLVGSYDINNVNSRCFGKSCYFYSYLISSLVMILNCMLAIYIYKYDVKSVPYSKEKEEKIIPINTEKDK